MIIVDNALKAREEQGKPIRVAILGAGFMSQGLTNQIAHSAPGMRIVAIQARTLKRGVNVCEYVGLGFAICSTQAQVEDAIAAGKTVVTEDAFLLARSERIDVLVDTTGSVEFGAQVVLEAFQHKKDVLLMNAEIDATIGPVLHTYADHH